jgi:hypothetical protein
VLTLRNSAMNDKNPQDTEILNLISAGSENNIDPQRLINKLSETYKMADVIESLQRAIERGRISLNSEGMVVAVNRRHAHAA